MTDGPASVSEDARRALAVARTPAVWPAEGDFAGSYLQTGTRDLYLSNTVRMHRRLRAAGVDAELHVGEAMPHCGFTGDTPEDLDLAAEQSRFLDRHRRA